jgi:hypothetical protein
VAIVGSVADTFAAAAHPELAVTSLVDEYGEVLAFGQPKSCVERAAADVLRSRAASPRSR